MHSRPPAAGEDGHRRSGNVMWFLGQFFMIPVAALVYGFELLVTTMQGMQRATTQGMEVIVGGSQSSNDRADADGISGQPELAARVGANGARFEIVQKEERILTTNNECGNGLDKDLHDDMLKLVRYKVLFVRREYEVAFPEQEDLVSDNMDGSAFTAWKVAEFIQDLGKRTTPVPIKWSDKSYPPAEFVEGNYLNGIPHEDKKYLRVYYEVLDRYPREKFKYEEQQIRVLEEIRDSMTKAE